MKVYQAEINAGLEKQIKANASIAYTMPTMIDKDYPGKSISTNIRDEVDWLTKASAEDDDVFKVYSILVSTSWNKNDDVFGPEDVWVSKSTPLYKPTNIEHNEKEIVGNIIGNWPVDKNFELINEDTDINDLPDVYHILVASVIYRQWQDPEYRARAEKLITEIQNGEKAVSMECIFKGFDYAVESPNGEYHIIARGENTAFLTQHLRAYGGNGVYQNHRVGRLLKNITFSGKGFVANPANPDSIIFNVDRDFPFSKASYVEDLFLCQGNVSTNYVENPISELLWESDMSEYLEKEVSELKAALDASKAEVKDLTQKLSEASVKEYEAQIEELKASLDNIETEKQSYVTVAEKAEETIASLEATIAELTEKLTQAEAMMHDMKEKDKKEKRMASLVDAGMEVEEAAAQVDTFENLSDEQFEIFAMMMKKYNKGGPVKAEESEDTPVADDEVEASVEETESEVVEASEEVLESVDVQEDVNLSIASDSLEADSMSNLRSSLNSWVSSQILKR
jgi:hypothetical protein